VPIGAFIGAVSLFGRPELPAMSTLGAYMSAAALQLSRLWEWMLNCTISREHGYAKTVLILCLEVTTGSELAQGSLAMRISRS